MLQDNQAFSGFSVDDINTARTFYRDTLGVPVSDSGIGISLDLKGTTVFIYPKGPSHTPASFTVLNFKVNDLPEAIKHLTAKGVTFEQVSGIEQDEQGIMHGKQMDMGPDIAWFKDPAGNTIGLLED